VSWNEQKWTHRIKDFSESLQTKNIITNRNNNNNSDLAYYSSYAEQPILVDITSYKVKDSVTASFTVSCTGHMPLLSADGN